MFQHQVAILIHNLETGGCCRVAASAPLPGEITDDRLSRKILETALAQVPGYASWRALDPGPAFSLDCRYRSLPELTKADLRVGFPKAYVPRGRDLESGLATGEVIFAQTSGSTEDQVTVVFAPQWWEASERSAWELNAHARRVTNGTHREAVLASARCVGPGYVERPRPLAERILGRHLYLNQHLNPALWTDAEVSRMAAEWNSFTPVVVEADPAYLAPFLRRCEGLGLVLFRPQLVFLTYSFPSRLYLRQIRRLAVPIASSYGSTETGHVFMECEAGRLHQNTTHCRVDFIPWRERYGGPRRGRMLVTVFHNPWFVPLRFDIGDVARRAVESPCPCGRTGGLELETIEGRVRDVTFGAGGRAITVDELDSALAEIGDLWAWQLEVPEPGRLRLAVQAPAAAARQVCAGAADLIRPFYGASARIEVAAVDSLRPEASGKFRFARIAFPVEYETLWHP